VVRIVADTNIYISALNFGGTADEVLALARRGSVGLCISPAILDEIEGVLVRKFQWSGTRAQQARRAIRGFAILIKPIGKVQVVIEDEADNRILECAEAGKAAVIVTGDRHLLKLQAFRGIQIITARQFLNGLMQGDLR